MKTTNKISGFMLAALSMFTFISCESVTQSNVSPVGNEQVISIVGITEEPIDDMEQSSLLFMREEEKVARDVYLKLYELWGSQVFQNISSSEQRHMDAILTLLDRYGLVDPAAGKDIGEFTNADLQKLYDDLLVKGSVSWEQALHVGALIEEVDIQDLKNAINNSVDNQDVTYVYEQLKKGSVNHLNAFVTNLSRLGISYEPQYLTTDEYNSYLR